MPSQLPYFQGPAGAAFQLRKPASEAIVIEHTDGIVTIRAGAPCVTVELRNATPEPRVRDTAWRVVQEAFDIRAATHRQALSTFRGDHEYAYWLLTSDGYALVIVDVLHSQWNMNATPSVTPGPNSPAQPPPPPPVPYHPALRFYRLSQLSEDLYDAFRNAYLALECVVSDVSLKQPSESEPAWLTRVLVGPLADAVPGGLIVAESVEKIYKFGRLPLFHAKTGSVFYVPQGEERAEIQSSLATLHLLLASIMNRQVSPLISAGWGRMSQRLVDEMGRVGFNANEIVFGLGIQQETHKICMEVIDAPRRFGNIWARVTTPVPAVLSSLESITFRLDGNETILMSLPELIPLRHVSSIRLELNKLESNVRAPNPLHPA
jgi:hypothetical protein